MTSAAEGFNDAPVPRSEFDSLRERFERMAERIEDLEDALIMRRVEEDSSGREYLPIDLVDRMLAGEHPVRIWREHRGLTMNELADKAGVPLAELSNIEKTQRSASVAKLEKIATALGLDLDDIAPRST